MTQLSGEKRILGIDPGTNILGYSIVQQCGKSVQLLTMDVLVLGTKEEMNTKMKQLFDKVTQIIDTYHPDMLAIEAPFFGKNVQSMLKLGRSQGVAIAAAIGHSVPVHEYAPMKIKMAITGQGQASKEQVADMLKRLLRLNADQMPKLMDATDALGVAYCHFMQQGRPVTDTHYNGWKDFINKNQDRLCKG